MKKSTKLQESTVPEKIQEQGGLNSEVAKNVSLETGVPAADVYGVGSFFDLLSKPHLKVRVCTGLSCIMNGSEELLDLAKKEKLPAESCSCLAACDKPVAVLKDRFVLPNVTKENIISSNGNWKNLKSDHLNKDGNWFGHIGVYKEKPLAINLGNDPTFKNNAFKKSIKIGSEGILSELDASGLQGRGGAAFPAGRKWRSLLDQKEKVRYVVLNADESEPGTFKDREIILRRPDKVLEGLAIAAKLIGASDVYCYLRGEFQLPIKILSKAIKEHKKKGSFPGINFHIHEGHGAYICGEETALLEALEGRRGMPRLKPPFPTEVGLWGKPTLIHNVETIACIPSIINNGGDWFNNLGITGPGSKVYCISGNVKNPGIYELPLGVTLDELVNYAGGYLGILKAFSPGGASSGFLPAKERNRPLDWKSLSEVGSSLGSAGVVVLNDSNSMKKAVRETLLFFENESCGQCAPCRIGSRFQRESIDRYIDSNSSNDLNLVDDVAWEMEQGSICGLGHVASVPLTSARKWFPEDFE